MKTTIPLRYLHAASLFADGRLYNETQDYILVECHKRQTIVVATDGRMLLACRYSHPIASDNDVGTGLFHKSLIRPLTACGFEGIVELDWGKKNLRIAAATGMFDLRVPLPPDKLKFPNWRAVFPSSPPSLGNDLLNLDFAGRFCRAWEILNEDEPGSVLFRMHAAEQTLSVKFPEDNVFGLVKPVRTDGSAPVPDWAKTEDPDWIRNAAKKGKR